MPKIDFTSLPRISYVDFPIEVREGDKPYSFQFSFPAQWSLYDQAAVEDKSDELLRQFTGHAAVPVEVSGRRIPVSKSLCNIIAVLCVAEETRGQLDPTPPKDWITFSRFAPAAWNDLIEQFFTKREELYASPSQPLDTADTGDTEIKNG